MYFIVIQMVIECTSSFVSPVPMQLFQLCLYFMHSQFRKSYILLSNMFVMLLTVLHLDMRCRLLMRVKITKQLWKSMYQRLFKVFFRIQISSAE